MDDLKSLYFYFFKKLKGDIMSINVVKEIKKLKCKNFLEYVYLENEFRKWLIERGYSEVYTEKCVRDVRRFYKLFGKIPSKKQIDELFIPSVSVKAICIYRTELRKYHDFLHDQFNFKIE